VIIMGWFDILKDEGIFDGSIPPPSSGIKDSWQADKLRNYYYNDAHGEQELYARDNTDNFILFPQPPPLRRDRANLRERISWFVKTFIVDRATIAPNIEHIETQHTMYLTKLNNLIEKLRRQRRDDEWYETRNELQKLREKNVEIVKKKKQYEMVNDPEKLQLLGDVYDINLTGPYTLNILKSELELQGVKPIPGLLRLFQKWNRPENPTSTNEVDYIKLRESMLGVAQTFKFMGKPKPTKQDIMDELDISPQEWDSRYDEILQKVNSLFLNL
tara:strand:+ start:168 stop:986 length:819 start_codon:yes stop_codon:yes gene_type:complete